MYLQNVNLEFWEKVIIVRYKLKMYDPSWRIKHQNLELWEKVAYTCLFIDFLIPLWKLASMRMIQALEH